MDDVVHVHVDDVVLIHVSMFALDQDKQRHVHNINTAIKSVDW